MELCVEGVDGKGMVVLILLLWILNAQNDWDGVLRGSYFRFDFDFLDNSLAPIGGIYTYWWGLVTGLCQIYLKTLIPDLSLFLRSLQALDKQIMSLRTA